MDKTPSPPLSGHPHESPYLTLAEAAAYARCSTRTLRRWIDSGKLTRLKSSRLLVDKEELNTLMRESLSETA